MVEEHIGSEVDSDTGQDPIQINNSSNILLFQSTQKGARVTGSPDVLSVVSNPPVINCSTSEPNFITKLSILSENCLLSEKASSAIRAIKAWEHNSVQHKANSPSLTVSVNGYEAVALLDEGANLNCIDQKLVNQ